jgi:glutamine synthetase
VDAEARSATADVVAALGRTPDDYVKVAATDIDGVLRGKYLDKAKVLAAIDDGLGFCDVVFGWDVTDECYDNGAFTGWHSGYPDTSVRLDPETHRQIPWEGGRDLLLGDFVDADGAPLAICPRQLLRRIIERARDAGYDPRFGLEFEWFNFRESPQSAAAKDYRDLEPLTPGMFGYSVLRTGQQTELFDALLGDLRAYGVPLEGLHTETGPGVMEAAICFSGALDAADRAVLFKSAVKEITHRFGVLATFMARPHASLPGCGGHAHQSLWDLDGERNLFHAADEANQMSPLFRHYVAGLVHCLPAVLPLLAPNVNSYKRLVDGFWAPTRATWGHDNRTVACRVLTGSAKASRVEARVAGADVNPYLLVAAWLAAGLYGVEHRLELDTPTTGSGYADERAPRLARTLGDATTIFADSELALDLFGEAFVDHYARTRQWEWRQYADALTDWEMRRYLEII